MADSDDSFKIYIKFIIKKIRKINQTQVLYISMNFTQFE